MTIETRLVPNFGKHRIDSINGEVYYVPEVDGVVYSYVAETEDIALIIGLGIKHDGLNSQFAKMATRMLGIDSNWSK